MISAWAPLLSNFSLLGIFVLLWSVVGARAPDLSTRPGQAILGALLGVTTIIAINSSVLVMPGLAFDMRHPLIAASGLVGGPVSVAVTSSMAIVARAAMGGDGVIAGVLGIAITAGIGVAFGRVREPDRYGLLVMLAASVTLGALASLLALDEARRTELLMTAGTPFLTLTFAGTFLISKLILTVIIAQQTMRSNLVYRDMVRDLPDCLNAKDLAGRFIVANDATSKLMRTGSVEKLIGKTDYDFYPKAVADAFAADERAVVEAGEPVSMEQRFEFPDGQTGWLTTLKVPYYDDWGRVAGLITHNRDTTALHELSELKEQFIAHVSHELRTPLTSINGALQILEKTGSEDLSPKARTLVELARRNSRHLLQLVDELLDVEKLNNAKYEIAVSVLDTKPVLEEVVKTGEFYLQDKAVSLSLTLDPDLSNAVANDDRLRQVLTNLVGNAIKFSPERGRVSVEARDHEGWVRISVFDDGPGVSEGFEKHLFDKFTQESRKELGKGLSGTGLGLSIAKALVEKMSGRIEYSRASGRTSFTVFLPAAKSKPQSSHEVVTQEVSVEAA